MNQMSFRCCGKKIALQPQCGTKLYVIRLVDENAIRS